MDMKQAAEKLDQSDQTESSASTPLAAGTTDRMARLWYRMKEIYGKVRWETEHGVQPSDGAARRLGALTVDELRGGIARCQAEVDRAVRNGITVWPPSLYEFALHARNSQRKHPSHQNRKLPLERPKLSQEEWGKHYQAAVKAASDAPAGAGAKLYRAMRRQ